MGVGVFVAIGGCFFFLVLYGTLYPPAHLGTLITFAAWRFGGFTEENGSFFKLGRVQFSFARGPFLFKGLKYGGGGRAIKVAPRHAAPQSAAPQSRLATAVTGGRMHYGSSRGTAQWQRAWPRPPPAESLILPPTGRAPDPAPHRLPPTTKPTHTRTPP